MMGMRMRVYGERRSEVRPMTFSDWWGRGNGVGLTVGSARAWDKDLE
jgi:hypothetical protein